MKTLSSIFFFMLISLILTGQARDYRGYEGKHIRNGSGGLFLSIGVCLWVLGFVFSKIRNTMFGNPKEGKDYFIGIIYGIGSISIIVGLAMIEME